MAPNDSAQEPLEPTVTDMTKPRPQVLPHPLHLSSALLLVACLLLTCACTRRSAATDQAPEIQVDIVELTPDPPAVGQAALVVRLSNPDGSAQTGASVSLKADMTHAGMTPVFSDAVDEGNGRYRTTFEWTMAGDWILTVTGTLADGRTFQREFQMDVATDGG